MSRKPHEYRCSSYGIKNCDTMRKAFGWLDAHGIAYDFHDYKKLGIPEDKLRAWARIAGWEALVNRRGPTFRKLPPESKEKLDEDRAIALMREHPSLIRRPVIEAGRELLVGFEPQLLERALASHKR